MHKYHIMAPGPTEVPPSVLAAASTPLIHHRTRQFRSLLGEVSENLKSIFLTQQPVLILNAGGTGGMEACIINLSDPHDTILVISGGVFGERWAKIGESHQRVVIRLEVPWGEPVDPWLVAEILDQHPEIVLVAGTLTETSTAVEHPIKELAKVVSTTSALLVVDAISGLASSELRMDEWEIDAVIAGTQKGLMCPPGLALVALSARAQRVLKTKKGPKFYWSFETALKSLMADSLPDTPWTPNVSLVTQLHRASQLILEEGLEHVWRRHQLLAQATRAGISGMQLRLFSSLSPSPAVTAVYAPNDLDSTQITNRMLEEWGISIVAGQGKLKHQIFRIGHLGYCDQSDVLMTLAVLEVVLNQLEIPIPLGNGVSAAQEIFLNARRGVYV